MDSISCKHSEVYRITPLNESEEPYYYCGICKSIVPKDEISNDAKFIDCAEDDISRFLKAMYEGELPKRKYKRFFKHKKRD